MSPVRVLAVVGFAAILVVAALFLTRPSKPPADAASLMPFSPATAAQIIIERPDGRVEAARRGESGDWEIDLNGPQSSEHRWPANPSNVRAALQLLSQFRPSQLADDHAAIGKDATRLRVVSVEPGRTTEIAIRLDPRILAGKALAQPETPAGAKPVWIDSQIAEMLIRAGPREWRETVALPDTSEVSRVTLRSGADRISLARVQGKWALREPIAEPADPDAVVRLVAALAAVKITDFLDAGPPTATGLETSGAGVTLEADQRDPTTGRSRTLTTTLRVGQPADMSAKGIFAAIARPGLPERPVIVSAEPLASLSKDPAAYVSRVAVTAPSSEVGAITIGERRFTRAIDGWTVPAATGGAVPATPADVRSLTALLTVLTATRADSVKIDDAKPGGTAVSIADLAGAPIASVTVEPAPPEAKPHSLLVRTGTVSRLYASKEAAEIGPWISGL